MRIKFAQASRLEETIGNAAYVGLQSFIAAIGMNLTYRALIHTGGNADDYKLTVITLFVVGIVSTNSIAAMAAYANDAPTTIIWPIISQAIPVIASLLTSEIESATKLTLAAIILGPFIGKSELSAALAASVVCKGLGDCVIGVGFRLFAHLRVENQRERQNNHGANEQQRDRNRAEQQPRQGHEKNRM